MNFFKIIIYSLFLVHDVFRGAPEIMHGFFVKKQQHCLQIFKKNFQMNYSVGVRDGLMICIWRVNHVPDPVLPGPAMRGLSNTVDQNPVVSPCFPSENRKSIRERLRKIPLMLDGG